MAISRRAAAPKGGRPTQHSARSCAEDASGISEKSIPRRRVGRPFFPARPARADDANCFAIASPPYGVGHDEHTAAHRTAQAQKSSLLLGVTQIRAIEGLRVTEDRRRLFEGGTPCLARLIAAFRVSHSNTVQYIRNSPAAPSCTGPFKSAPQDQSTETQDDLSRGYSEDHDGAMVPVDHHRSG